MSTQLDNSTDRYGNEIKIIGNESKEGGYQNLVEEEDSSRKGRTNSKNNRRIANLINDQSSNQVFTQGEEEEKTQDLIKQDLYVRYI